MGRPKKTPKKPVKTRTIGLRTSEEWAEWLERFAKANRTDVAKLIDISLAELAKAQTFEPPPDRVP